MYVFFRKFHSLTITLNIVINYTYPRVTMDMYLGKLQQTSYIINKSSIITIMIQSLLWSLMR